MEGGRVGQLVEGGVEVPRSMPQLLVHECHAGGPASKQRPGMEPARKDTEDNRRNELTHPDLAEQLQDLPKLYPAVRIDLKAMPEFLGKARENMVDARIKDITPIVGEKGTPYERTVLLMLEYSLDEQRQLVAAMMQREADANLLQFLREAHDELQRHFRHVDTLLNRRYFSHPSTTKPG